MTRRREPLSGEDESILAQAFVEGILNQAKKSLTKEGALIPGLFLRFKDGRSQILPLDLREIVAARQIYFAVIGLTFHRQGKKIHEALFLDEILYVEAGKNRRLSLDIATNLHPKHREAIVIVGHNAPRTRYTMVVQPFWRDRDQQPVFEPPRIAVYNAFGSMTSAPMRWLDHLFPKRSRLSN